MSLYFLTYINNKSLNKYETHWENSLRANGGKRTY